MVFQDGSTLCSEPICPGRNKEAYSVVWLLGSIKLAAVWGSVLLQTAAVLLLPVVIHKVEWEISWWKKLEAINEERCSTGLMPYSPKPNVHDKKYVVSQFAGQETGPLPEDFLNQTDFLNQAGYEKGGIE